MFELRVYKCKYCPKKFVHLGKCYFKHHMNNHKDKNMHVITVMTKAKRFIAKYTERKEVENAII